MSFVITIDLEAADLARKAQAAGKELDDLSAKGKRAGTAISQGAREGTAAIGLTTKQVDNLARSFEGLANHMLSTALGGAAKAFSSLTDQIEREQKMLERIEAPTKRFIQDIQTVENLMKRGAITANQYVAELERIGEASGKNLFKANPADAVSLGAPPTHIAPQNDKTDVMGALGTAAELGGAGYLAKQVLDLSDSYTSLENRLRGATAGTENLNEIMEKTRGIADRTRSEWTTTGEAFVRLSNATKQLGLSQNETLALTETISKALQLSGASSSEAAGGMMQLTQALSSGRLQGDEFRTIMESLPSFGDIIAKQMGVTRGELKALSAEGKITTDIIVKAFQNAGSEIDDKFSKTIPTAEQSMTALKNEAIEASAAFVRNSGAMETLGTIVKGVSAAMSAYTTVIGAVRGALDALGPVGTVVKDTLTGLIMPLKGLYDLTVHAKDGISELISPSKEWSEVMADQVFKLNEQYHWLDLTNGKYKEGTDFLAGFADNMLTLGTHTDATTASFKSFADMIQFGVDRATKLKTVLETLQRTNALIGNAAALGAGAGLADHLLQQAKRVKLVEKYNGVDQDEDRAQIEQYMFENMDSDPDKYVAGKKALDNYNKQHQKHGPGAKYTSADQDQDILFGTIKTNADIMDELEKKLTAGKKIAESIQKELDDGLRANGELALKEQQKFDKMADDRILHLTEIEKKYREFELKNGDFADRFQAALGNMDDRAVKDLKDDFDDLGKSIIAAAMKGESLSDVLQQISMQLVQRAFSNILKTGEEAIGIGSVASSVAGYATGGSFDVPYAAASGASWQVAGQGGTDSQIAQFRVTPGEHVKVETPEQHRAAERDSGSGSGSKTLNLHTGRGDYVSHDELPGVLIRLIDRDPAFASRLTGRRK